MVRYRKPESVKKRIDLMLKNGKVTLDHGVSAYEFDHYEYEEPSFENGYKSKLTVFYKDFDKEKTIREYMQLTEDNLKVPGKDDLFSWFVDCYWEKEFPTLLYMKEYQLYH